MPIRLYNSLTREKEDLQPPADGPLKMYSCGVTVYDRCHIGHARSLYIFEVMRRYFKLRLGDDKVRFVRNITDIDDKIINRARESGRDWKTIVDENIAAYYADLALMGISPADEEPRATEHIADIIADIEGLIGRGAAYAAGGDVYFRVRKFAPYGRLSGQSINEMLDGVRIDPGENKDDSLDFALWKTSKPGEPFWPSPWGDGRPGWHIECSCMSRKCLKTDTLDIHAGGRDLIFPHHENEIAQAEALTGQPFARVWIHHGLLTIDAQKMAKSLGNFITITDAVGTYGADALKFLFLSSHYRSAVDFSAEKMEEAKKGLARIAIFLKEAGERNAGAPPELPEAVRLAETEFLAAMDDDVNTPRALAAVYELITSVYQHRELAAFPVLATAAAAWIKERAGSVFGLAFGNESALSDEEQQMLDERRQARVSKDFKRSDELRDLLKGRGIIVEDKPQGQTWRRG